MTDSNLNKIHWENKIWGRTRRVDRRELTKPGERNGLKYQLEIIPGGCCSFHYHVNRSNTFTVYEGRIRVVWTIGWRLWYRDLDKTSEPLTIRAGIPHQFQCLLGGPVSRHQPMALVEEIYHEDGGPIDWTDIERLTVGTVISLQGLQQAAPGIVLENGGFRRPSND